MKKTRTLFSFLLMLALLVSLCALPGVAFADNTSGEEEASTWADEAAEIGYHAICDVCPADMFYKKNVLIREGSKQKDSCIYSFDTVYGHFVYEVDLVTGEATAIEEPDMEAARKQPGFREPIPFDELLDLLFESCPIEFSQTGAMRCSMNPDDSCVVRFDSAYGEFLYVIDPFTGEILEREEPDMESVKADPNFRERLSADDILTCVFQECPIDIGMAKSIKVARRADDCWAVTFGSGYGDFLYVVDAYGEIISKSEPDVEAAKAAGVQEPLSHEDVFNRVFAQCPIKVSEMKDLNIASGADGSWIVTFGSDYGDFLYRVDGLTGEILERSEPEIP